MILATQNPQDQVGTQALPESQLDRFGVVLELGYPSSDKERAVMARQFEAAPNAPHLDLMQARQALQQVAGFDDALSYLSRVVEASRADDGFRHGLSTRGALVLADLARALAWIESRDYLTPADVQQAFYPMARHRLVLNNAIPGQLTQTRAWSRYWSEFRSDVDADPSQSVAGAHCRGNLDVRILVFLTGRRRQLPE